MKQFIILIIVFLFACAYSYPNEECNIIRVIDGDTIICDIDGWSEVLGKNISVRMRDCDSPEIRSTDAAEKSLGLYAKNELIDKIGNSKNVSLRNIGRGKYFRLVADVYLNNEKLTCFENKLAYATPSYKCGTKTKCSQMSSCSEALFYLKSCGLSKLDRDHDGIPCESICN